MIEITSNNISGNRITLPWEDGSTSYMSDDFRKNIKKEDGWIMLFHTFKEIGLDERSNYMMFYNKLSGVLKVFYYYDATVNLSNGFMWHIALGDQSKSSKLFNMTDFFTPSQSEIIEFKNAYLSNASLSPVDGISYGWNGLELEVAYDELEDLSITIGGFNRQIASVELSGNYESTSEGTITSTSSSQNFGKLAGIMASVAGGPAFKLVKKIASSPNIKLGSKITKAIEKLTEGDVGNAIKGGLNMIFGKSTVVNEQQLKFSTQGTINLGGTIESTLMSGVAPIAGINIKRILNNTATKFIQDSTRTSQIVYSTNDFELNNLGIWNLAYAPKLSVSKYSRLLDGYNQTIFKPEQVLPIEYEVLFNPDIEKYIKNYSITHDLVLIDIVGGEVFNPITPLGWDPPSARLNKYNECLIFKSEDIHPVTGRKSTSLMIEDDIKPVTRRHIFFPAESGLYDYFYEWPGVFDNYVLLVTVEIEYNYMNKTQKSLMSRYYRVNMINSTDYDQQILMSGRYRKPYIIKNIDL